MTDSAKGKLDTVGMTVFTRSEFSKRLARSKERMVLQNLDLLIVTDPANMHYLTGYDGWSFYMPQCVVVALDKDVPIWIGRGIDAPGVPVTTYLPPEDVYSYDDSFVHVKDKHPAEFIARTLKDLGYDKGRIGVELDSFYCTAKMYKVLEECMDSATLVDSFELVNWIRAIKSYREIDLMKEAGLIIDRVMNLAIERIQPGMRQCDLVAEILKAQVSGLEDFGGDYTAIVPLIPTGENTSIPHLTWTDKEFQDNEVVVMELSAARHHYHCPMARTVYLGEPPAVLLRLAEAASEGIEAAIEAIKPGNLCEDIELPFARVLAKYGYEKSSRMGYSIGLGYPPDWGEHTMSIRLGAKEVLKPNMTFHLMPGLWEDRFGVEITQTFRVTDSGCEFLGTVPRRLFVKNQN